MTRLIEKTVSGDISAERSGLSGKQKFIVFAAFIICFTGAILFEPAYCPDEVGRQCISNFIYLNGRLPTGNEPETIMEKWGFSYALRPYLSSMINALFMKIVSLFTVSYRALLTASRMCSIFALTGASVFILKSGNLLFEKRGSANLMAIVICFVPQVMFLGMYQNNDSLLFLAVCMETYFLIKGHNNSWDIRTCAGLGVSYAAALLSYYSAAPWLLFGALFCIVSCVKNKKLSNKTVFIFGRIFLITSMITVLAGWFYIRNYLLHNGDFLGIYSEEVSRNIILQSGSSELVPYRKGSLMADSIMGFLTLKDYEWIRWSIRSMIGCFRHMEIWLPLYQYGEYYALMILAFVIFVIVAACKKKAVFTELLMYMAASSAITVLLSLFQSYYRDYEPQGRYIITVWILIGYIFGVSFDNVTLSIDGTKSSDREKIIIEPSAVIAALWILMFIRICFESMSKMIK